MEISSSSKGHHTPLLPPPSIILFVLQSVRWSFWLAYFRVRSGAGSSYLCRIWMKVSVASFVLTATTLQNEEVRDSRWRTSSGSSLEGEDGDPSWERVPVRRGRLERVRTFTTGSLTIWLRKRDKDDLVLWIRYSTYQRSPDLHSGLSKDPAAGSFLSTLTVIPSPSLGSPDSMPRTDYAWDLQFSRRSNGWDCPIFTKPGGAHHVPTAAAPPPPFWRRKRLEERCRTVRPGH